MALFWKIVKGIWDPKAHVEAYIETQAACFKKLMRHYRERDPHAWLAGTLQARPGWGGKSELVYYIVTHSFSVLPVEQAPVALGLYVLFREEPGVGVAYEHRFGEIMAPVFQMRCDGTFPIRWRSLNPWTRTHFPEVAGAVATYRLTFPESAGQDFMDSVARWARRNDITLSAMPSLPRSYRLRYPETATEQWVKELFEWVRLNNVEISPDIEEA